MNNVSEAKNLTPTRPEMRKTRSGALDLEYEHGRESQKVKGVFHFYEVPGGTLSFPFRKYKQDQIERYDLIDGCIYELPLAVAKHLNSISYPEYGFLPSEPGGVRTGVGMGNNQFGNNQTVKIIRKVKRCGFQSLEFMDVGDVGQFSGPIIEEAVVVK